MYGIGIQGTRFPKKEKEITCTLFECFISINMILPPYFDAVDFDQFQSQKKFSKNSLGFYIERDTIKSGDKGPGKYTIAIIGVPHDRATPNKGASKAPDQIRKHLYQLSCFETSVKIIDLGNLKSGKSEHDVYFALRDIIDYLNEEGIISVIIGGGQDLSIGIARAFQTNPEFTMAVADSRVDVKTTRETTDSTNFLTKVMKENPALFHLNILGIQGHFVAPDILNYLKANTFDYLQLGHVRDDFPLLEPILRNSHFLSFDISCIRQSDAPGHFAPSPNGFYSEEACQIARYAGLSNRLTAFGLFEVNPALEKTDSTTSLAAQIIWYFLEGTLHRRKEDPAINKDAFTRYFVEMEEQGETLVFFHQPVTNRWWIEISYGEGDSWIIACSESDYRKAITREVPEICLKYLRKTERQSK